MRYLIEELTSSEALVEVRAPDGWTATLSPGAIGAQAFIDEMRSAIARYRSEAWSEHTISSSGTDLPEERRRRFLANHELASLLVCAARAIEQEVFFGLPAPGSA
jgi:hypothetical protein